MVVSMHAKHHVENGLLLRSLVWLAAFDLHCEMGTSKISSCRQGHAARDPGGRACPWTRCRAQVRKLISSISAGVYLVMGMTMDMLTHVLGPSWCRVYTGSHVNSGSVYGIDKHHIPYKCRCRYTYIYMYCICIHIGIYINVCTHCTPRHAGCRMCLHIVGWRSACLLNHTNAQIPEHSRRCSRVRGAVLVHMGRNIIQPGCCRLPLSLMSACAGLLASQHWRGTCAGFTYSCGLAHVP